MTRRPSYLTSGLRELPAPRTAGIAVERLVAVDRDSRTPAYVGIDPQAGRALRALRIAFVGAGSVGGPIIEHAARSGVAEIIVIDRGEVRPVNLLNQPVDPPDVGRPKAAVAGGRAKALSPETRVRTFARSFEDLPLDALAGVDVVVLAADNIACEVAVTQRCVHLGIPCVQASVHGPTLTGQLRVLNHDDARGDACLACSYGSEWDELDRGTRFSCAGDGASTSPVKGGAARATMSPVFLCALTASLASLELARRALGISALCGATVDRMIEMNGYTLAIETTQLQRNPDCPIDHARWQVVPPSQLEARRVTELLESVAGDGAQLADFSLSLERHRFSRVSCGCRKRRRRTSAGGRFLRVGLRPGRCPACREPLRVDAFDTWEEVPLAALAAATGGELGLSLADLGAVEPATALLRGPDAAWLFGRRPTDGPSGGPSGGPSDAVNGVL